MLDSQTARLIISTQTRTREIGNQPPLSSVSTEKNRMDEETARVFCGICRAQLDSSCPQLQEHQLLELAAIATMDALSEMVRREARALLEEARA